MHYVVPQNPHLGGIGEIINPVRLIDQAVALGPTRIMTDPRAGFVSFPGSPLAGVGDYREALDVLAAVNFLFP
jgi:hypothetical protein